jgi:serine kinase of HPr protein (carbohydrate metabolism regulator)
MKNTLLHASCVSIENRALLIMGESGSGKSDLALRLIEQGAELVADDYVEISLRDNALFSSPPTRIAGVIEARGVGILKLPYASDVVIKLAVKLVAREAVERLPEPQFFDCLGYKLPLLCLHGFDASATAKIRFAMAQNISEITGQI